MRSCALLAAFCITTSAFAGSADLDGHIKTRAILSTFPSDSLFRDVAGAETLDLELEGTGVHAFSVSPGFVRTDMTERFAETEEGRRFIPDLAAVLDRDGATPPEACAELLVRIAKGDLSVPVELNTRDELGELARSINDMCDRLGMDTITAGNVTAFAIEARRRGRIDFDIDYGQVDRIAELLLRIAHREGVGDLLAEGVRAAARDVGTPVAILADLATQLTEALRSLVRTGPSFLVTGATSGIGKACADAFLARGAPAASTWRRRAGRARPSVTSTALRARSGQEARRSASRSSPAFPGASTSMRTRSSRERTTTPNPTTATPTWVCTKTTTAVPMNRTTSTSNTSPNTV